MNGRRMQNNNIINTVHTHKYSYFSNKSLTKLKMLIQYRPSLRQAMYSVFQRMQFALMNTSRGLRKQEKEHSDLLLATSRWLTSRLLQYFLDEITPCVPVWDFLRLRKEASNCYHKLK